MIKPTETPTKLRGNTSKDWPSHPYNELIEETCTDEEFTLEEFFYAYSWLNESLSSSLKHRTLPLPHSESDVEIHNGSSFLASPLEEPHSSYLTWYSSSWEVLDVKVFHCHLVTTRPCQSGLTHQGFLHLTKSIYFSSIEGDISRRGLSDIHNFWIEKIVISADRGFSWIY